MINYKEGIKSPRRRSNKETASHNSAPLESENSTMQHCAAILAISGAQKRFADSQLIW